RCAKPPSFWLLPAAKKSTSRPVSRAAATTTSPNPLTASNWSPCCRATSESNPAVRNPFEPKEFNRRFKDMAKTSKPNRETKGLGSSQELTDQAKVYAARMRLQNTVDQADALDAIREIA